MNNNKGGTQFLVWSQIGLEKLKPLFSKPYITCYILKTIPNMAGKKVYTADEIKKIAPRYRGKVENFDPERVGKKILVPPKPEKSGRKKSGPATDVMVRGSHVGVEQKPTPQRNEPIISEAIFGVDVHVTAIDPRQNFATNLGKLPLLAAEVYNSYQPDEKQLDRQLIKEELVYYSTGLMWLKLIDVKAKQGRQALTSAEKDIRKATQEIEFNVPQPIHAYLSQIGNVTDKMGEETELEVPALPVAVAQGFGGYHANVLNQETHNLFEEVPLLGIAGDMVMAASGAVEEPIFNHHIEIPEGSRMTRNLCGCITPIGPRRIEVRQWLAGYQITPTNFPEYIPGTRFNLRYMMSISDTFGKYDTFRNEKVCFRRLTLAGGESQIMTTRPTPQGDQTMSWTTTSVQPTSSGCESAAEMGASYVFGFHLYKEDRDGPTLTLRSLNWSCVEPDPNAEFT
jgi:hypothetical protein